MTAADLTFTSRAPRIPISLKQLLERFLPNRSTRPDPQVAMMPERQGTLDPGLAVAQVVHDLRNELMVALRCAENFAPFVPAGEAARELEKLRSRTERASLLARDLLLSVRPRPAARCPVDLNRVINQCAGGLSSALGHGVEAELRLSADPLFVHAEPMELERILLNLVLNAHDAIGGAGGIITIGTESVSEAGSGVRLKSGPPYARLTITDTGSGVPHKLTSRVFDPFFTTKPGSPGLGLSSVGYTVRELQGTVVLTSERGRGTTATVVLPLSSAPYS